MHTPVKMVFVTDIVEESGAYQRRIRIADMTNAETLQFDDSFLASPDHEYFDVVYDSVDELIYWTDNSNSIIWRSALNGTQKENFISVTSNGRFSNHALVIFCCMH